MVLHDTFTLYVTSRHIIMRTEQTHGELHTSYNGYMQVVLPALPLAPGVPDLPRSPSRPGSPGIPISP